MMPELAGVMVGNYFLLECLEREGMVETYLARPTIQGGYDVHLRIFRPRFPDSTAFHDHFPDEVRKVWRCQHENIEPLVEFGEGDDLLYTASRADGMLTLAQILERQGADTLSLPVVAKLFAQICDALQYAHERGIAHGNLQPSSILLGPDGQARLTNFSLRRAYREGDPTVAQVEEGNAAYVAPEQAVGMLTPASDIYALGVLLYRLLGGLLPYDGASAGEIALLRANEPIPSLRALRPDLPRALELVTRVALAKSPAARFPTPRALAAALMKALVEEKPPVIPPQPPRRIEVTPRRTSLTWSRAFALMALLLVLVGLGSTFYLFSFSTLPLRILPGLPLRVINQPGAFPIFLPILNPNGYPTPTGGIPAVTPTPGHSHHPTPGQQNPTPTITPPPPIQQSPIVSISPPPGTPVPAPPACAPGTLKMDGSFYLSPLLQQVGNDYTALCPGLSLGLEAHGCRVGLRELVNGQVDLAASDLSVRTARPLTDYPVAALLYAVVVSPDVQLSGLSSQQLQAIYQGQITNWAQVGGPDEAITILLHPASDPLKAIFQAFVLNGRPEHEQGVSLSRQLSPAQIAQQVAQTSGAITYVPLSVTGATNVRVLSIDRAQPTPQNLLRGSYAFWSVEHLYAMGTATVQAQSYLQFLQSPAEANLLAQFGAVPPDFLPSELLASHLPGPVIGV